MMANDNYVIREKYNGLVEVNGQLVPQRGTVLPEELVATQPDNEEAHNNGGGAEPRRRRRRTFEE
ncbi:hypothetical protein ACTVZ7_004354 [Salmonella enterica]|nr:hypothetical protein [Salmonella enterica]EIC6911771.1 hypothetical protein [Salmonella enterica subsp. enterica serovar Infantis]ELL4580581.1 hypothetical protein [Salmonella enterica]